VHWVLQSEFTNGLPSRQSTPEQVLTVLEPAPQLLPSEQMVNVE
jgi:hypothetical protein